MAIKKDLKYYLDLNWSYTIEQEFEKGKRIYIVRVNELSGVCSDGKTIDEAMENVKEAMIAILELYLAQGDPIPEPFKKEEFKGKISYRTTSRRHHSLAKIAKRKHISMNKALDMIFDAGMEKLHFAS